MHTSQLTRFAGGLACVLVIAASATTDSAPRKRDAYKDVAKRIIVRWEPPLTEGAQCVGTEYMGSFFVADRYNKPILSSAISQIEDPFGRRSRNNHGASVYHRFVLRFDRWPGSARNRFSIHLIAKGVGGGRATKSVQLGIRHCLSGRWVDGRRTLEIVHKGNSVTAWLARGKICGRTKRRVIFSGTLKGARLKVKNLVVCYPRRCVGGDRPRKSFHTRWKARVSPDSRRISGKWLQKRYDTSRRGGQIVCRLTERIRWVPLSIGRSW